MWKNFGPLTRRVNNTETRKLQKPSKIKRMRKMVTSCFLNYNLDSIKHFYQLTSAFISFKWVSDFLRSTCHQGAGWQSIIASVCAEFGYCSVFSLYHIQSIRTHILRCVPYVVKLGVYLSLASSFFVLCLQLCYVFLRLKVKTFLLWAPNAERTITLSWCKASLHHHTATQLLLSSQT